MTGVDWTKISLFEGFSEGELEQVKPIFRMVTKPAASELITEGEEGDEMFVLVQGRVQVTKAMLIKGMKVPLPELSNPRKVLATLDAAIYPAFGEMALIDRDTRSATVTLLTDCQFLETNRERFFSLAHERPALGLKLLFAICRRLTATVRRNNAELVKLTTALALALSNK
jgi:CRP-like cAMP-binding protein